MIQTHNWVLVKTLPQTKIVIYDNDVAGKKLIKFGIMHSV
jgi:hypothetical protein